MTIQYQDKEIVLKYGFKAFLIYENITGKTFNPQTLQDIVFFLYACICAGNKETVIQFDDFLDYLDENPNVFQEFSEYIAAQSSRQNTLSPVIETKETKKKK